MKPQIFLRLMLLLPYALWVIGLAFLLVLSAGDAGSIPDSVSLLFMLPTIYVFGAIFWFVPYTLLALGLLLWSLKKQTRTILRAFVLSPLFLVVLMVLEMTLFSLFFADPAVLLSQNNQTDLLRLNLLAAGLSLGAGYLCVALGYGVYRLLRHVHVIKEPGTEIPSVMTEAV
jgi:hypothetical protein